MENRTALRGAGTSKGLVVLFAVIVAIGLGVMAAFVAKSVSGPAAATQTSVISAYDGPGADARSERQAGASHYADDAASTGHGELP